MSTPAYSRYFMPRVQLGELCLLWDGSNFIEDGAGHGVWEVVKQTGLTLVGQHGAIIVWTQAGSAPAGYVLDQNAISGTIAAGTSSAPGQAKMNQSIYSIRGSSGNWDLAQLRVLPYFFGALPASWAVQDADILFTFGQGINAWSLPNAYGSLNMMAEAELPSQTQVLPAQGANLALTANQVLLSAFETGIAQRSEMYLLKDLAPLITINNNGGVTMNNAAMGLALVFAGYRMRLRPLTDYTVAAKTLLGQSVHVPTFLTETDARRLPIIQIGMPQF